jgi:hypothetical protein
MKVELFCLAEIKEDFEGDEGSGEVTGICRISTMKAELVVRFLLDGKCKQAEGLTPRLQSFTTGIRELS